MQTHRFTWRGSYMNETWYDAITPERSGQLRVRHGVSDYERSIYNGDSAEYERECAAATGILRWESDPLLTVDPETVAAFNAWRAETHATEMDRIRAHPERYGPFEEIESDPMFAAPVPQRAGVWQRGFGWRPVDNASEAA